MNQIKLYGCFTAWLLALSTSNVNAKWSAYVDNKIFENRTYGYMTTVSTAGQYSKLKLECTSPGQLEIFLDERITYDEEISGIELNVDSLPPISLTAKGVQGTYNISNKAPGFWDLIAQMSAGVILTLDTGNGNLHQYSLNGFTNYYTEVCGWMNTAVKYRVHLDRYR